MKNLNFLITALLCLTMASVYAQPEASEPGKCYARCLIADQYENVTERVLVKEATSKVSVSPATYETVTDRVLTKEAATTLSVTPATFETATVRELSKEAGKRVTINPATFETATERVIKQINAPGVSVVPATFETVTERKLVKDAYTTLKVVPATFETVTEKVLVQDAYTTLKVVPAEYETITDRVLVKEGYTVVSQAPAITDLAGLLDMANSGSNTYSKGGVTRSFTAAEIANIKALAGQSGVRLTKDSYGNVYATMTERVLDKEAYSTISTSPATYETVTERYVAKEAGTRIERRPAGYETVTETIQTAAATTKWVKKKDQNCLSVNPEDCTTWCLVEVPAQNRTVTKQVLKSCAAGWTSSGEDCIRTVEVPAEYATRTYQKLSGAAASSSNAIEAKYTNRTYKKLIAAAATTSTTVEPQYANRTYRKVSKPASAVSTSIPAQYANRTFQKLKTPATTEVVEIPAQYTEITMRKLASDASTREVACGKSSILDGITFRSGSAQLTASSDAEVSRLASMMKNKPAVTARLVGHTDSDGGEAANQLLSSNRAKAVYDALVGKGIAASRLSYDGRGESEPIATNATAAGKRQNRRTEFITFGDDSGEGDCTLYETRTFQKLATDASANMGDVEAEFVNRSFQKLATDAAVSSTDVPAQYGNISMKKLANAASTSTTEIPAQYRDVTKRNLVKAGGFTEWREVVCEADITPAFYRQVQSALNAKGYNVGAVDGVMGAGTKAQLVKFQRDNGLPVGQLDLQTLKALGINR